jgi:uncharacterized protein (TIGR02453 family)
MAFAGWPSEAVEFFEGLEEDNTKSFWQRHLGTYEISVKRPTEELLGELEPEFGAGRLFRPYRDVRFSKDKSPYKTNIAAAVGPFGYVTLSAEGLGVGAGMYVMAPDQLDRYRKAVDAEKSGTALELIVQAIKAKGYACAPSAPLKTGPRGYPKDHARTCLLNGKGITVWKLWPVGGWLSTTKAKERVVAVLCSAVPLNDWLAEHVGDSDLVSRTH